MRKKWSCRSLAQAPVKKGENAGRAVFSLNGEELGSTAIIYTEDVEKAEYADYLERVWRAFLGEEERTEQNN